MKVHTINPGYVFTTKDDPNLWRYTTSWDGVSRESKDTFNSAAAAKQAMREYVAHQRKRNGL